MEFLSNLFSGTAQPPIVGGFYDKGLLWYYSNPHPENDHYAFVSVPAQDALMKEYYDQLKLPSIPANMPVCFM